MKSTLYVPAVLIIAACALGLAAVFAFSPGQHHSNAAAASASKYGTAGDAGSVVARYASTRLAAGVSLVSVECEVAKPNGTVSNSRTERSPFFVCLLALASGAQRGCAGVTVEVAYGRVERSSNPQSLPVSYCAGAFQ